MSSVQELGLLEMQRMLLLVQRRTHDSNCSSVAWVKQEMCASRNSCRDFAVRTLIVTNALFVKPFFFQKW